MNICIIVGIIGNKEKCLSKWASLFVNASTGITNSGISSSTLISALKADKLFTTTIHSARHGNSRLSSGTCRNSSSVGRFEILSLSIVRVTEISEEDGAEEIGSMTSGEEIGITATWLETLSLVLFTEHCATRDALHSADSSFNFLQISKKSP